MVAGCRRWTRWCFSANHPGPAYRGIAPDVLVKGGDWPEDKIVGAAFVRSRGGQVFSLPWCRALTTALVNQLKKPCP